MIEVVFCVVAENVDRLFQATRSGEEYGHVAHNHGEGRFHLLGASRGHTPLKRVGEFTFLHVFEPRRIVSMPEPLWHVADASRFIYRQRAEAASVERRAPGASALRGAAIARLHLARSGALPIEVNRPKGEVVKEMVPAQRLQAV